MIKAIVGLGNPGEKYAKTRHNIGFWFVDQLAERDSLAEFRKDKKLHGAACKITVANQAIWLLKPDTFMNKSGIAIGSLAKYYGFSADEILVVHDELDLPVGAAKLKASGGYGGHNGLRDTIAHIGKDFLRLRLGIGHPGQKELVLNYVLGNPGRAEYQELVNGMDKSERVMPDLIQHGLEAAQQTLHTK